MIFLPEQSGSIVSRDFQRNAFTHPLSGILSKVTFISLSVYPETKPFIVTVFILHKQSLSLYTPTSNTTDYSRYPIYFSLLVLQCYRSPRSFATYSRLPVYYYNESSLRLARCYVVHKDESPPSYSVNL